MEDENKKKNSSNIATTLHYHRQMLSDGKRNKLLFEAIKQNVTDQTHFLDIGAGTGVWAILAAKLGAKRVVAVEIEDCLIPIIHRHAEENGVADKVEIIHAHSDDVRIEGKFDLIVSELFGDNIFEMNTIESFVNLRNRFLATDGVLIPQKMALFAAPAQIDFLVQDFPAELPLTCNFFKSIQLNFPQNFSFSERRNVKFLADPQKLIEVDFRSVGEKIPLNDLSGSWKLDNINESNAFVTYYRSYFTDDKIMNNFKSKSWGSGIYEFIPFKQSDGELRFNIDLELKMKNWSVSLPSHPNEQKQSYSPVFATGHIKMMQKQISSIKFSGV